MAHSAHHDPEMVKEFFDSEEELEKKMDELADLIKNSKHVIFFTGAGISTSAGISDFRGPKGIWTMAAQGLERERPKQPAYSVVPTISHMIIVEMFKKKLIQYLISQNCDGVHRKSGVRYDQISELHGNCGIEICEKCGKEHHRDFPAIRIGVVDNVNCPKDHFTGRYCTACKGRLLESTVDFKQSLPEEPLRLAEDHGKKADLCIVLGSSCTVAPACLIPKRVVTRNKGKLVIVNLQKTPLHGVATMNVHAKIDKVMSGVAKRLSITPEKWIKKRKFRIDTDYQPNGDWKISVEGLLPPNQHPEGLYPFTNFRRITVQIGGRKYITPMPSPNKSDFSEMPFEVVLPSSALQNVHWGTLIIGFYGWHEEIPIMVPLVVRHSISNMVLDYNFDVTGNRTWELTYAPKYDELVRKFELVRNKFGSMEPCQSSSLQMEVYKTAKVVGISNKVKEFGLVKKDQEELWNSIIQLAKGEKGMNNSKYTKEMNDFLCQLIKRAELLEKLYPLLDLLRYFLVLDNGSFLQFCMFQNSEQADETNIIEEWRNDLIELYEESETLENHGNQTMILRFFCNLFENELFAQKAGVNQVKVVCSNLKYNPLHVKHEAYNLAYSNLITNYAVYLKKWHFSSVEKMYLVSVLDSFSEFVKNEEKIVKKMKVVKKFVLE